MAKVAPGKEGGSSKLGKATAAKTASGTMNGLDMSQQQSHGARIPRQVAVIAVRRDGEGVKVCLIRRKDSEKWGIPKGFIDRGDTAEQAALNEACEEAGLRGRIMGGSVGSYDYEK